MPAFGVKPSPGACGSVIHPLTGLGMPSKSASPMR